MTQDSKTFLNDWFERYVNRYRNADGVLQAALELKYHHSRRVAENTRLIAQMLGWGQAEILTAESCGLIHDIGRFLQHLRYGSFHDADTVDHGRAGRLLLDEEGIPAHLNHNEWLKISHAVEYHNKKVSDIPNNLPSDAVLLLKLIRDADKLDITDLVINSITDNGFKELSDMLPHITPGRELTPEVIEEVLKTKTVSVTNLRTITDFLMMMVSWFYDLNYAPSLILAADRRILERIEKELPKHESVGDVLNDVKTLFVKKAEKIESRRKEK